MSNAIYNLIVSDKFSRVSQIGDDYTQGTNADVKWKQGKRVTDSLKIAYHKYKESMDLDSNPTPFKGMDITKLLTQSQLEAVKNTTRFPGIKYNTGNIDKNGYTKNEYLQCDYWTPKTVGFYQLRNSFTKVNDSINTYMFV